MMSDELERIASQKAHEAIQLERAGSRSQAIAKYKQAIDVLLKLCQFVPEGNIRAVYMEKIREYQTRVGSLTDGKKTQEQLVEQSAAGMELVLSEKPNVKWDDIVNIDSAKKAIRESIVYPYKRPDLFPLGWPRGILIFGPPGCGKTLLGAAVATEVEATFFYVDAASVISKWLGESEKNISKLFSAARESLKNGKLAIVFVDEVDSLIASRIQEVGGEARARNQLLKEMDGLTDKGKREHLYFIGATNKPWELDEPFVRRFQKRIFVSLPDFTARLELFRLNTRDLVTDTQVYLEELARLTENYSANDIHDICMAVQIKVVAELFESGLHNNGDRPRPITMDDFLDAIRSRRSSVSLEGMQKMLTWNGRYGAS